MAKQSMKKVIAEIFRRIELGQASRIETGTLKLVVGIGRAMVTKHPADKNLKKVMDLLKLELEKRA